MSNSQIEITIPRHRMIPIPNARERALRTVQNITVDPDGTLSYNSVNR
ncbi:uncharacterized protein METZ01_LOCUS294183 [marine metagenome]|uniref:Uncharacterized protein n=1 Tax=marine metagenome TaxID=408172 RepID=A0A382LX58_9ZZZZ